MGHQPGGARTSVAGSIPAFLHTVTGFCLHGPHAHASWWLFSLFFYDRWGSLVYTLILGDLRFRWAFGGSE